MRTAVSTGSIEGGDTGPIFLFRFCKGANWDLGAKPGRFMLHHAQQQAQQPATAPPSWLHGTRGVASESASALLRH